MGVELYDHTGDDGMAPAAFDDYENTNLAGNAEWAALEATMRARLVTTIKKWMTPWAPGSRPAPVGHV